jgi:hypothetical protein
LRHSSTELPVIVGLGNGASEPELTRDIALLNSKPDNEANKSLKKPLLDTPCLSNITIKNSPSMLKSFSNKK